MQVSGWAAPPTHAITPTDAHEPTPQVVGTSMPSSTAHRSRCPRRRRPRPTALPASRCRAGERRPRTRSRPSTRTNPRRRSSERRCPHRSSRRSRCPRRRRPRPTECRCAGVGLGSAAHARDHARRRARTHAAGRRNVGAFVDGPVAVVVRTGRRPRPTALPGEQVSGWAAPPTHAITPVDAHEPTSAGRRNVEAFVGCPVAVVVDPSQTSSAAEPPACRCRAGLHRPRTRSRPLARARTHAARRRNVDAFVGGPVAVVVRAVADLGRRRCPASRCRRWARRPRTRSPPPHAHEPTPHVVGALEPSSVSPSQSLSRRRRPRATALPGEQVSAGQHRPRTRSLPPTRTSPRRTSSGR